jgi:hypothetical protein
MEDIGPARCRRSAGKVRSALPNFFRGAGLRPKNYTLRRSASKSHRFLRDNPVYREQHSGSGSALIKRHYEENCASIFVKAGKNGVRTVM